MKKILFILLSLFIILINIFSNENYLRVNIPWGSGLFSPQPIIDLRYPNSLEKSKDYNKLGKAYEQITQNEKDNQGLLMFYNYLIAERKLLRSSKLDWLENDANKLYKRLTRLLLKGNSIYDCLPLSISIVYYKADGNKEYSNIDLANELVINKNENLNVGNLLCIDNNHYAFLVYGYKLKNDNQYKFPIIFCVKKIQNSIFESLNDKYEITSLFKTNIEISEKDIINNKVSYISPEKKIIYGLIDYDYVFKINQKYKSKADNLRIRSLPSLNYSEVIEKLNKKDIVILLETGEYEVINDIGGNWVKIKTQDNKVGWCFSAYLEEYNNAPNEL